jgi:hypothetical protein
VGLSFHWDSFEIEGMVGEKIVRSDFDGGMVRLQTRGAWAACLGC